MHDELSKTCREFDSGFLFDENVMNLSVFMQPGYGHHGQVILPGKLFQFFCAHHRPIRAHDFKAKTAGGQAGQSAQVNGRFRMTVSFQDAAGFCNQRKEMPRAAKILRGGDWLSAQALAGMARSWADIPVVVVTWSTDTVKAVL